MGSIDVPAAAFETVWLDGNRFADAERQYYEASLRESKQKKNPAHVSSTGVQKEKKVVTSAVDTKKQQHPSESSPEKHLQAVQEEKKVVSSATDTKKQEQTSQSSPGKHLSAVQEGKKVVSSAVDTKKQEKPLQSSPGKHLPAVQEEKKVVSSAVDTKKEEKPLQSSPGKHFQAAQKENKVVSSAMDTKKKEQPSQSSPGKHGDTAIDNTSGSLLNRMERVEQEHNGIKQEIEQLTTQLKDVLSELSLVKDFMKKNNIQNTTQVKNSDNKGNLQNGSSAPNDEDDLDLFGSDEETEEDKKVKEERLKAYAEKKSKKPALVAKSSVVLDVKPWDDETDMKAMETAVRKVTLDGLVWGASKLVPLAYSIKKLQIVAIVEDDKVSIDWLQETIQEIEDLVQSVDIAAFNKL